MLWQLRRNDASVDVSLILLFFVFSNEKIKGSGMGTKMRTGGAGGRRRETLPNTAIVQSMYISLDATYRPPQLTNGPPFATDFPFFDNPPPSTHVGMRRRWDSTTIYISNSIPITTLQGRTLPRRRHRDCMVPSYRSLARRTSSSCLIRGRSLPPVSSAVRSCRVSS